MFINLKNVSIALFAFLAVITQGAVYYSIFFQNSYAAILGIIFIALIIATYFKIGIPKSFFVYCIITALCYFLSAFINGIGFSSGLNIKTALIYDMSLLICLVAFALDGRKFINYLVWIVTVVSAISLVFYTIENTMGRNAISQLFTYYSWGRGHYANLFYTFASNDTRNYSIFYEPGVFQIVTISSLYLLIFGKQYFEMSVKKYVVAIIILIAAVLTGGSTTGYINLLFIVLGVLLMRRKSSLERGIAMVFSIAVAVLFIDYIVNGDGSILTVYVMDKIFTMTSSSGNAYYASSGGARLFMFHMALQALAENPFFGIGNTRVSAAVNEAFFEGFGTGNGLGAMIASKGLVTAFVTIAPILVMGYRNRQSMYQYTILLLIYFNTIISQSTYSVVCCAFVVLMMTDFRENKETVREVQNGFVYHYNI